MTAGIHLHGNGEAINLQQQVARLQALLEASRLVHSTIREEDVLEQVLHIVVRGLEMSGATLPGTGWLTATRIQRAPRARTEFPRGIIRWMIATADAWPSWWLRLLTDGS
jgi:hypothetical protein